jgi:biotin operon repressor
MMEMRRLKLKALLVLARDGWSAIDIAMVLSVSRATVERHVVEYHRVKADTEMKQKGFLR